jgi:hypothetical protein
MTDHACTSCGREPPAYLKYVDGVCMGCSIRDMLAPPLKNPRIVAGDMDRFIASLDRLGVKRVAAERKPFGDIELLQDVMAPRNKAYLFDDNGLIAVFDVLEQEP